MITFGVFSASFGRKRSYHVMDASADDLYFRDRPQSDEFCFVRRPSESGPRPRAEQFAEHSVLPAPLQKLVGDFFYFGEGSFVGKLAGILRDFFE